MWHCFKERICGQGFAILNANIQDRLHGEGRFRQTLESAEGTSRMNILERPKQRPGGRSVPRSEDKGGPCGWSRGVEGNVAEVSEQEARWCHVWAPGAIAEPWLLPWVRCGRARAWSRIATATGSCSERDTLAAM